MGGHHNSVRHALGFKSKEAQQKFCVRSTLTKPQFPPQETVNTFLPRRCGNDGLTPSLRTTIPEGKQPSNRRTLGVFPISETNFVLSEKIQLENIF